jgi:PAS domain S-box-containing protein
MEYGAERLPVRAFRQDAPRLAILALAYFLAQELALSLPGAQESVAAVWPAAGIGLAALLLSRRRLWPAILLILFVAGNSANLLSGRPFAAGFGFMIGRIAESLACAWLIVRWGGEAVRFTRVKEVLALIVCATGVNACTALLGAATATLVGADPFWNAWQTWWVADGLGILLVTPLISSWAEPRNWLRGVPWQWILEACVFMAVWSAAGILAFLPAGTIHYLLAPKPYMLAGILIWPALRLGQRIVTLALVLMAVLAVTSRAVSVGPLVFGGAGPLERMLAAQVCIAFVAATGLLLASSYAEAQAAERISREGLDRLRALEDNLPNGMVYQAVRERDGSYRFLHVSAGVAAITGVSAEEVLRDPAALRNLTVEEDRPAVQAALEKSSRDRSVLDIVSRMRRRDGEVRWFHTSSAPRTLPDGRIVRDGTVLDITDRIREEGARRASEERFRLLVENAELPVVITSVENAKLLFINECAARYFEIPPEEEIHAQDYWRDLAARERYLKMLSQTGKVTGFEIETVTRSGQSRWATVSASLIDFGGQPAVFTVFSDITALKEATAKLEHERAVLSAIFQTAPDMIWMKDAEGRYVACNPATERFFALPASAIIGKGDREIFPPEITQVILAEDRAAIASGGPRIERAWVTAGGEESQVLLETTKTPMLDVEGRLAGILCVARDITAAHKTQEALRERIALQERLETIAAAVPGALFSCLHQPAGKMCLRYASPAFEAIHGVPSEGLVDDSARFWMEVVHPADRDRMKRAFMDAERTSSLLQQEYRLLNPAKGEIWVEMRAVPVPQPEGGTLWHGFVMDISERKAADAALAEEVVRRRILFERANDGIAILDLDGRLLESNPAFARMLGYTQEEMRRLYIWDWDARWNRLELLSKLADRFFDPAVFETRHRRKDGSVYEAEVSAAGAELGGRKYLYCVLRDTTGRKAAEEALEESRRLEGIGILAGGMAHEFNNLLTVINGYSAMLSRGFDFHDPMREQAEAIRGAGERAAMLTQQLLAYGRKQIIRPGVLDLNLVVERGRRAWMPLLGPGIRLKVELNASPGFVSVDGDRMREVLANLVKNAVQALANGGALTIATANALIDEQYAAQHAGAHTGPHVMLSVTDTGVGMDEGTLVHVFEPFFTTRDRATTTGLGLAMVHGSVAQHGGWITVDSAPGKGSAFKIYLPQVEERGAPYRISASAGGEPERRATILVVEDEEAVRRLTVSVLQARGFHTLEAADGPQAMAAVERHAEPIDLILSDVVLPGTTGPELVEQLKARVPSAKVLYTSGYPAAAIADYGVIPEDLAFLQKPYSPDLLVTRVREILGTLQS